MALLASYGGGFSCSMLRHAGLVLVGASDDVVLDAFRLSRGSPRMVEKLNVDELVLMEVEVGGGGVLLAAAPGVAPSGTIAVSWSRAEGSSLMASS